jgi:catechol 2,3-dioxygenase-like lactoylglutathione lyase family enzyme
MIHAVSIDFNSIRLQFNSPKNTIEHIRHVGIVVSDLEESLRFYTQKMQFVVPKRMDESGSFIDKILGCENLKVTTVKMTLNEGQMIELLDFKSHKTQPGSQSINDIGPTHLAFTVSNVDDIYEEFS